MWKFPPWSRQKVRGPWCFSAGRWFQMARLVEEAVIHSDNLSRSGIDQHRVRSDAHPDQPIDWRPKAIDRPIGQPIVTREPAARQPLTDHPAVCVPAVRPAIRAGMESVPGVHGPPDFCITVERLVLSMADGMPDFMPRGVVRPVSRTVIGRAMVRCAMRGNVKGAVVR